MAESVKKEEKAKRGKENVISSEKEGQEGEMFMTFLELLNILVFCDLASYMCGHFSQTGIQLQPPNYPL